MDMDSFDGYIDQMKEIALPKEARTEISAALHHRLSQIEGEGPVRMSAPRLSAVSPRHGGIPAARSPHRILTRRRAVVVAACTGMLLLGAAALTVANEAFPGLPVGESAPFALAAYAEGTPVPGSTAIVTSNTLIPSHGMGSYSEGEAYAEDGSWDGVSREYTMRWFLDLSSIGDDIESVEVMIAGEGLCFRYRDRAPSHAQVLESERSGSTLTLTAEQARNGQFDLEITVPLEGELAEAEEVYERDSAQLPGGNVGEFSKEEKRVWHEVNRGFQATLCRIGAEKLAQSPITLTARLHDGTTVSHTYRFSPVEDFEQLYMDDQWRYWEAPEPDARTFESSALFQIEQLS